MQTTERTMSSAKIVTRLSGRVSIPVRDPLVNKARDRGVGSHGYLVDPLACVFSKRGKDTGRFRDATIREGKSVRPFIRCASRSTISAIHDAIPHFPRQRFARRLSCPYRCVRACVRIAGCVSARRHGFHPRVTLPSATRPCCGRRAAVPCPDVRFSGTGRLLVHCEKTNPSLGPFSFLLVAFFLRP